MTPTLVILVVGLTPRLLGPRTPRLATLTTGEHPAAHGAVAKGRYFRDLNEVLLWRQPETLLSGETIWDAGRRRDPAFTCAKMFWRHAMKSFADIAVTPRPIYPADGRKIPDHYARPDGLHDELDARLGRFPLFAFWGPLADITSSAWIAEATPHVMATRKPTLTLTYLPHLDYDLQRLGPIRRTWPSPARWARWMRSAAA